MGFLKDMDRETIGGVYPPPELNINYDDEDNEEFEPDMNDEDD